MKKVNIFIASMLMAFTFLVSVSSLVLGASAFSGPAALTTTGMSLALRGQGGSGLVVEAASITGTASLGLFGSAGGLTWTRLRLINCANGTQSLTITGNGSYSSSASGFRYLSLSAVSLSGGRADVGLGWGDGQPCISDGAGNSANNPSFYILVQTATLTITPTPTRTPTP